MTPIKMRLYNYIYIYTQLKHGHFYKGFKRIFLQLWGILKKFIFELKLIFSSRNEVQNSSRMLFIQIFFFLLPDPFKKKKLSQKQVVLDCIYFIIRN